MVCHRAVVADGSSRITQGKRPTRFERRFLGSALGCAVTRSAEALWSRHNVLRFNRWRKAAPEHEDTRSRRSRSLTSPPG